MPHSLLRATVMYWSGFPRAVFTASESDRGNQPLIRQPERHRHYESWPRPAATETLSVPSQPSAQAASFLAVMRASTSVRTVTSGITANLKPQTPSPVKPEKHKISKLEPESCQEAAEAQIQCGIQRSGPATAGYMQVNRRAFIVTPSHDSISPAVCASFGQLA